jgi:hypothetical protein
MKYELNGREVSVIETDLEVGEGCYVLAAHYEDTGEMLTEEECLQVEENYQSDLYQNAYEHKASAAYDSYKDRMKYGE